MRKKELDLENVVVVDTGRPNLSLIPKETKTAVYKELLHIIIKEYQQKEKRNKKGSQ